MIAKAGARPLRQQLRVSKKLLRQIRQRALSAVGYEHEHWARIVQRREWHHFLSEQSTGHPHVLEISPEGASPWRAYATGSYTSTEYPQVDICRNALARTFDIVIAEQVFEHLPDPDAAARNVRAMVSERGVFLIATPFLVKVHGKPHYDDFTRWTPDGLKLLLEKNGFQHVTVHAWGNLEAVRSNFRRWTPFGWGRDLRNDPDFPMVVWAYARP